MQLICKIILWTLTSRWATFHWQLCMHHACVSVSLTSGQHCTTKSTMTHCVTISNIVALSWKLRIFTVALYWTKRATWNVGHPGLFLMWNDAILVKMFAKNYVHISVLSDLDLWPFDLTVALPVTPQVGKLSSKFECYTLFHFHVNGWRGTDGQTYDG